MSKTKSYKSVSSYLRSYGTGIKYKTSSLKGDEQKAVVKAEQRKALNNLLPQIDNLPILEGSIDPIDGINQLLARGGTDRQIKALQDCARWLKNFRIVPITVHPQVKTADGLVSYQVTGFKRDNHNIRVSVIVDTEQYGGNAFALAEAIAGPDYCFVSSGNLTDLVNDAAKNRLFLSEAELFEAAPELAPKQKPTRRGIASYQSGGVASVSTPPDEPVAPAPRRKKTPLTPADWRR